MKHRLCSISAAIALAVATFGLGPAQSQVNDESALDHLKCYRIVDTLEPAKYIADLRNQFGLEPGCMIAVPARAMCVETEKKITSTPPPPGGGPSGTAAGHFLCYLARCPESAPLTTIVEDQFGRRPVVLDRARIVCAPANKLICGDGEIDPGEQCDPGSAATNICPDGSPCRADCTCPGPPCPCGTMCEDDAGNVGQCVQVDPTSTTCECRIPPGGCPCGVTCTMADGVVGQCQPVAGSNICECGPIPGCPCGTPCQDPVTGQTGRCEPGDDELCECKVPPECPCDASCVRDGEAGICRPSPPLPGCECFVPPGECECGKECVISGVVGKCKGGPNGCHCEPPDDCHCGKDCVTFNGEAGKCRPLAGLPPGVCGCAAR